MKRALATLGVLGLTQCHSPPPPPPPPAHAATPVPSATVSVPVASVEAPPPPPPPKAKPEPPPPQLVNAGAFVVWIEEASATGGFRSALVEPGPSGAKVVADRPEVVVVGPSELWSLRTKQTPVKTCAECSKCGDNPPKCKKNNVAMTDEPYLQGLGTGRVLEPWQKTFQFANGCADGIDAQEAAVAFAGAVGGVLFADLTQSKSSCDSQEFVQEGEALAFDMEKEQPVELSLPDEPKEALLAKASAEMIISGCTVDRTQPAALYRSRAAYGDDGVLHGLYAFTMSTTSGCGSGPDRNTVLSEQKSPWIPPQLAAFGKLPPYLVDYMADRSATNAMPIAAARVADAEREMARTDKELAKIAKDASKGRGGTHAD